jgi:hypothetical protein
MQEISVEELTKSKKVRASYFQGPRSLLLCFVQQQGLFGWTFWLGWTFCCFPVLVHSCLGARGIIVCAV